MLVRSCLIHLFYRLFLVSFIIAMKFHEEYYIENAFFFKTASKYCWFSDIKELNQLESMFLDAIDFRLKVEEDELDRYFTLIRNRSQELQFKQFKIIQPKFEIIEDYFVVQHDKGKETIKLEPIKLPPVFLAGKLFKNQKEVYNFFHCDEICEDKTTFSESSSPYPITDESPRYNCK